MGTRVVLNTEREVRHVLRYSPVRHDFTILQHACAYGEDTKRRFYDRKDHASDAWFILTGQRVVFVKGKGK